MKNARVYEINFVRGEKTFFTIRKTFEMHYSPTDKQSDLEIKLQKYERGGSVFCLDSIFILTRKIFRIHSMQAFSFCKLLQPYCH